jgi:hypothetical protein
MAIELPTEKSKKVDDIGAMSMLLYGPPKIGKTTIAASFPKALFVVTEEGHKSLEVFKVGIQEWLDFKEVCRKLRKDVHDYGTIVLDTADLLFMLCESYVCKQLGVDSPGDLEYGKGWKMLTKEFQSAIAPLAAPGKDGKTLGLVFISHEKDIEVKGRITKTSRTVCTLTGTARKVILPLVDVVGHCGFGEDPVSGDPTKQRVVTFAPSETVEAGDRTGKLPATVPMSPSGWYEKLQAAYKGEKSTGGGVKPKRKV